MLLWWLIGTALVYIICAVLSFCGILSESDWDIDEADDELLGISFVPVFNIFFGIYGLIILFSNRRKNKEYYNKIMECTNCGVYARRGRAMIASNDQNSMKCVECDGTTFKTTNENIDLKLDSSKKLSYKDIKAIKKGKHEIYNDNVLREQERRIREIRSKKHMD